MNYARYLIQNRHASRWYARVVIPRDLRPYFDNRRELRKSTKTADLQKAKLRALAYYLECQGMFSGLAKMVEKKRKTDPKSSGVDIVHWISVKRPRSAHAETI